MIEVRQTEVRQIEVRQAVLADAVELIRLRALMLGTLYDTPDDSWQPMALAALRAHLGDPDPTMVAFVVDREGGAGLAACVVGVVQTRLGGPANPHGRSGYVFSVSTDPDARRRGYARAAMEALMAWFADRGITKIDLRASDDGAPLYLSLGFTYDDLAMRRQP